MNRLRGRSRRESPSRPDGAREARRSRRRRHPRLWPLTAALFVAPVARRRPRAVRGSSSRVVPAMRAIASTFCGLPSAPELRFEPRTLDGRGRRLDRRARSPRARRSNRRGRRGPSWRSSTGFGHNGSSRLVKTCARGPPRGRAGSPCVPSREEGRMSHEVRIRVEVRSSRHAVIAARQLRILASRLSRTPPSVAVISPGAGGRRVVRVRFVLAAAPEPAVFSRLARWLVRIAATFVTERARSRSGARRSSRARRAAVRIERFGPGEGAPPRRLRRRPASKRGRARGPRPLRTAGHRGPGRRAGATW